MTWVSLKLWDDEEKRIIKCLSKALQLLIEKNEVTNIHKEKQITGKLRPLLNVTKKKYNIDWTIHFEASVFVDDTDPEPFGHPDIQFSRNDIELDQYDYHIECKKICIKNNSSDTDYCYLYVKEGVLRYKSGKYAQSIPPKGTMLGYVINGDLKLILDVINKKGQFQNLDEIKLFDKFNDNSVTPLSQNIQRNADEFVLFHLWADFRN